MTRFFLLTGAIVAGLVASGGAEAFGGARDATNRPSFSQLDANGDGKLTPAEMQAFAGTVATQRFTAADADGDGSVSRAELAASLERLRTARNAARADNMMSRLDTDRDGAISQAELTAAMGRNRSAQPGGRFFAWADADGDGAISEAEYTAAEARMQQRAGRFSQRGSGRGGVAPFWRQ